ncbi:hypothetical protein L1887_39009 [Cichorium endivia]|nr:hypothetical protein L1887_39009 [Cichorium endivia]
MHRFHHCITTTNPLDRLPSLSPNPLHSSYVSHMRISRFWKGTDSIRGGGDGSVQVQDPRDVFSHKIVQNHLPAIVNSPDQIKKKYDLRSLKWVISGGAPLSKELDRRVHGELPWSYDNATGIGASTDTLEESRRYGAAGML